MFAKYFSRATILSKGPDKFSMCANQTERDQIALCILSLTVNEKTTLVRDVPNYLDGATTFEFCIQFSEVRRVR